MIVTQEWTHSLPLMQQTVLLTATRGPDGLPKYGAVKMLLRWYRRCILLSALDKKVLTTPYEDNGGSFTGPSFSPRDVLCAEHALYHDDDSCDRPWESELNNIVDEYLRTLDAIPHHFQLHFMHGAEILGYTHPEARIRTWWAKLYVRLARDMHLWPETMEQLNHRLGDDERGWRFHVDPATAA